MALDRAPEAPLDLVEWRVDGKPMQRDGRDLSRFVPYLDAAAVATLLDTWVGPAGWRDEYALDVLDGKPVLWCALSIRDPETGEWVTKRDVGTASNFESQKGMVSDAFKRAACLKWGAGRNVYELPNLVAPCRIVANGEKRNAYPTAETLPHIKRELEKHGYRSDGGKVSPETGEIVGGPAASEPSTVEAEAPTSSASGDGPAAPQTAAGTADLPEPLESMPYRDLAKLCIDRGLKASGKSEALIARLRGEEVAA